MNNGTSSGAPVWLALWAGNMDAIRARGWTWPGFEYSEPEWQRLRLLADTVGTGVATAYQFGIAVIFLAIIGVLIVAIVGLLNLLQVDSASVPAWVFAATLPAMVFVMLGFILPVAMRLAASMMGQELHAAVAHLPASPDDAALAAKVGRQFRRVALFAAAVALFFVLSDALVPPPFAGWMPWIIAGCAGLFAMLFL